MIGMEEVGKMGKVGCGRESNFVGFACRFLLFR